MRRKSKTQMVFDLMSVDEWKKQYLIVAAERVVIQAAGACYDNLNPETETRLVNAVDALRVAMR